MDRKPYCGADERECMAYHTPKDCEVKAAMAEAEEAERVRRLEGPPAKLTRDQAEFILSGLRPDHLAALAFFASQRKHAPKAVDRAVWHHMSRPGVAACGADYANMSKTEVLVDVTCADCLRSAAPTDWVAKARMADDLIRSASDERERLRIVEKCLRWASQTQCAPPSFQETTDEIRRIEGIAADWLAEFGPDVEARDIALCHVIDFWRRTRAR